MPQKINVVGFGDVEFPDEMTQDQIKAALDEQFGGKETPPPTTGDELRPQTLKEKFLGSRKVQDFKPISDIAGTMMQLTTPGLPPVKKAVSAALAASPEAQIPNVVRMLGGGTALQKAASIPAGLQSGVVEGILDFPIAPLPGLKTRAGKAFFAAFGAQFLAQQPDQYKAFTGALNQGDIGGAAKILGEDGMQALILAMGGKEALKKAPIEAPKPPVIPPVVGMPGQQDQQNGAVGVGPGKVFNLRPIEQWYDSAEMRPEAALEPEAKALLDQEGGDLKGMFEFLNRPFSATSDNQAWMGANHATGKIEIYPEAFNQWFHDTPPDRRARGLRARLNEEALHLKVENPQAADYWSRLSPIEQALERRIYTGKWGKIAEVSDTMMGHEAVRRRLQQLARMETSEVAEAAFKERWTVKGLEALNSTVRTIRETLGTRASQEQLHILDTIQRNIRVGQAAIASSGEDPQARLKRERGQEQMFLEPAKAKEDRPGAVEMGAADPRALRAKAADAFMAEHGQRMVSEATATGTAKAPTFGQFARAMQGEFGKLPIETVWQHWQDALGRTLETGSPETLEAMRQAYGIEMAGNARVPEANRAAIIADARAEELQGKIDRLDAELGKVKREQNHLRKETEGGKPVVVEYSPLTHRAVRTPEALPLLPGLDPKSELKDLAVRRAKLEDQRKGLAMELSDRKQAARDTKAAMTQGDRYRHQLLSKIWREAVDKEAPKFANYNRESVAPQDIGWAKDSAEEPWYRISPEELGDPNELGRRITRDAAVSGKLNRSITRRVTALLDRKTGKVELVTTYYDGVRRSAALFNPETGQHSPLADLLKKYTPIASARLENPVKNFRQTFETQAKFEGEFGREADAAAGKAVEGAYPATVGQEGKDTEFMPSEKSTGRSAIPGQFQDRPGMVRSSAPLTDAEASAVLDHIVAENGNFDSPDAVKNSLVALIKGERKETKPRTRAYLMEHAESDRQALHGYRKMLEAIAEDHPDEPFKRTLERLATQLYADHITAQSHEEFVRRTVGRTGPQAAEVYADAHQAPREAGASPTARELTGPEQTRQALRGNFTQFERHPAPTRETMLPPGTDIEAGQVPNVRVPPVERSPGLDYPAAVNKQTITKARRALSQEFQDIMGEARGWWSRRGPKDDISVLVSKAQNTAGNMAAAAKRNIEMPSATGGWRSKTKDGTPQVLASARAINAAYSPRYSASMDPVSAAWPSPSRSTIAHADPAALDSFIKMTKDGQAKGQALINTPDDATMQAVGLGEIATKKTPSQIAQIGRDWLDAAKELEKEVQYAKDHFGDDDLMRTTQNFREEIANELTYEHSEGKMTEEAENYMPGIYDGELYSDDAVTFQPVVLGERYGAPKRFANQYEAIAAGPYIPKSSNVADIAAHRVRSGRHSVLGTQAFRSVLEMTDPYTGTPIGVEMEFDPKTKSFVIPGGDKERVEVKMQNGGQPIAVRRGYQKIMGDLFGKSGLQDVGGIGKFAVKYGSSLKHIRLAFDVYHPSKLFDFALAILGKDVGYRGGLAALDYRPDNMAEAVRRGLIPQRAMDWALEKHDVTLDGKPVEMTQRDILLEYQATGLNIGRVQDAMYKHFVDKIPYVGWFNHQVFNRITRGLMANTAVSEALRLHKSTGVDLRQVMRRVSKDVNTQFGSTGAQALVKNPTFRDFTQLIFLAPQWFGSRIATEAKFYSRLVTSPYKLATEGKAAAQMDFGSIGRGMGRGMVGMFVLTQAINLITRQQFTWQNEEEGHKTDAWFPDPFGGPGHWVSPFSIFMEMTHASVKYAIQGRMGIAETLAKIAGNKLGALGQPAGVLLTGYTPEGKKTTSGLDRAKETGRALFPIPITVGVPLQAAGYVLGVSEAVRPGAAMEKLFSSAGVKTETEETKNSRVLKKAADWLEKTGKTKKTGWTQVETTDPSYTKVRAAFAHHDFAALGKLVDYLEAHHKGGHTHIDEEMDKWAKSAFTKGTVEEEAQFKASLSPRERDLYYDARAERKQLARDFKTWYREHRAKR